jgi:acyl-CoA reductase-like NAD-dependent aldehyde dehydrogenase
LDQNTNVAALNEAARRFVPKRGVLSTGGKWEGNCHNVIDSNLPGLKHSGLGRENGAAAIHTGTEEKTVLMSV